LLIICDSVFADLPAEGGLANCQLNQEAFGLLVLLSFAISDFTPAAYQRHSL
jgi:hypothetical protein